MAALLRSGKFLRLVTGIARQNQPTSGATQINHNNTKHPDTSLQGPSEANFSFQSWSLHQLHGALPVLGSAPQESKDENDHLKLKDLDLEAKILQETEENRPKSERNAVKEITDEKQKPIAIKKSLKSGIIGFDAIKEEEETIDQSHVAQKAVVGSRLIKTKDSPTKVIEQKKPRQDRPSSKVDPTECPKDDVKLSQTKSIIPEKILHVQETLPEVAVDSQIPSHQLEAPETSVTPNFEYFLPPQAVVPMVQVQENDVAQLLPLHIVCAMFRDQGRVTDLENLLMGSYGIRREDRKLIFMWTLQAYADQGMCDSAIMLSKRLEWEGLSQDFPEFHLLMGQLIQNLTLSFQPSPEFAISTASTPYPTCPSTPASLTTEDGSSVQAVWFRKLKKALHKENPGEALRAVSELEKMQKMVNVNELSAVIELLVKAERFSDATALTENMLVRGTYPTPKIFRFLLNRLAATGQVESMNKLNQLMSTETRKEVSFDNRLCNAYLVAGRGREYLEAMERELDELNPQSLEPGLERLKDKFPRGGAMGILETDPGLVDSFSRVAKKFLKYGFVAPTNVLWTYHFITGKYDLAEELWNDHVKNCSQIMFQKVCQTARLTGNAELAWRLVDLLRNATVTRGARGIAYSCLIDVLAMRGDYEQGCEALRMALADGIFLSDINRTALKRLKDGCVQNGLDFSFDIPRKTIESCAGSEVEIEADYSTAMVAFQ